MVDPRHVVGLPATRLLGMAWVDGVELFTMWNLFSRRSEAVDVLLEPAPIDAEVQLAQQEQAYQAYLASRTRIAEVQRMDQTAVATLTITELTQEKGVMMLSELLEELRQTGARHFVLDIQNVQFMDSACLGCLVEALNGMAKEGGKIALANTANSVQYLFKMTQLDRVFPICADVMAALAAVERVPQQE